MPFWGLFPLYFRQIAVVPSLEVLLHRSVWSSLFVLGLLVVLLRFGRLREVFASPRRLSLFGASAPLLSCHWLLYAVFAIQSGQVVEASLGCFIDPIVNVLLGVLVLHERLPWIALVLALSFGFIA